MLFVFLVSLLGFAFVLRTLHLCVSRKLFRRDEMTKIGTAYFGIVILLSMIVPHTRISLWLIVFLPFAIMSMCLIVLMQRRTKQFRSGFRECLTIIILKMKAGRSFRQALTEITSESDVKMRGKLLEITHVVAFSQQRNDAEADPFVAEVIEEFNRVDREPHAASRRLMVFREKLRMEDDFRRRSGQVLARIRAQSIVMSGLYLAVLAFMIWKFGWRPHSRIMMLSMFLFFIGAFWIWMSGRRLRWKT